ncbi:MAG TPA: hypothetical protein VF211_08855 [Burkholderiales bacterium]
MRGWALAVLLTCCLAAHAAAPDRAAGPRPETAGLRSIAGWLKAHGSEGYLGADVARAIGVAAAAVAPLDARQRGFRDGAELRIAQLLPDGSLLFMVQGAGEVAFYHATPAGGLRRALVSVPARGLVLPLEGVEAQARFRGEVHYWEGKAANGSRMP